MLKKMLKNERGLTLIELLAVVVILGIIAAIAVPAIGNVIQNSKDDAKVSDALQVINAAKLARASEQGTTFKHKAPATGAEANVVYIQQYLDSADETGYTVTYENNQYSITSHSGVGAAGVTDGTATEKELKDSLN
ncbi:type II secretion system protein [Metabacillus idriensis]|uniref:type II secretion system protein n=1 Tax=Metabacillus idriensis TaxID=324768 RepID=UPI002813D6CF|nr:type II secretion system protein [Metabacillus idriensis]MDR0138191.1 type II secretion system protein [Metabacillus idriensis]